MIRVSSDTRYQNSLLAGRCCNEEFCPCNKVEATAISTLTNPVLRSSAYRLRGGVVKVVSRSQTLYPTALGT